jgi:putative thioredoxin
MLAEADARFADGDIAGAAELYAGVLKAEPGTVAAIAGLARAYLARNQLDQARQTLAMAPASAANDPALVAIRAQLDLAAETAKLGDAGSLEARIAANPSDHQARFDLALLLNAKGDRDGATDRLLEIMRKDRSWNEEKARKQLLQFFEAWGPTDDATRSGRRKLSSVLFA